ncbi:hypothetical protein Q765_12210 [Flavobacterium rivuli WB 3.3-2 = DSM 21788]|uniref:DUF6438 domain-containing protein n=1 Tax=Flavobacterium rivuli WB 3.3-2 = DSM 21788 TaxID=1121895 RepID=A0A0A2M4F2_9FLAO|nr:DUF6438 domain-containing protein [Flavobacterium rivuli]KGO86333.1 hypothetical protein Q765_12210 [Flavobacterium rivuli WB 3.3-2 = DSM 21788]
MKKIILFIIAALFVSCKKDRVIMPVQDKALTPKEMILGTWGTKYDKTGFQFFTNGACDFKLGFYDYERYKNDYKQKEKVFYSLGTLTKYSITKDSLKIYNLSDKKWDSYKVKKLSNDTLVINKNSSWVTFTKKYYDIKNVPDFDAVVVSSSGCFGSCPIVSMMISKDGCVSYIGSYHTSAKGNYTSKISMKDFNKIALRFKQADYMKLDNAYGAGTTDGGTVSVLLIKNGKIIKSIEDDGFNIPSEFIWAYSPLITMYQNLNLVPEKIPDFTNPEFVMAHFNVEGGGLELTGAEVYYLMYLLSKGKEVQHTIQEKYYLRLSNNLIDYVKTDGRYYKIYFRDSTFKVIDIGSDFLKQNKFSKSLTN